MTEASPKKSVRAAAKRSVAAQERLDQIVQAAVRLINERGYTGMSLQRSPMP